MNGKMEVSDFNYAIGVNGEQKKTNFEHKILQVRQNFKTKRKRAKVIFKVTAICNYSCDYCCNFPGETTARSPLEEMRKFIPYIKEIPHDKIMFYIFGGEPTLNIKLKEICQDLLDECKRLGKEGKILIQTNGSWSIKKFDKFAQSFNGEDDVTFAISYHPTETDVKQIMQVTRWLEKRGMLDGVNILLPDLGMMDVLEREMEAIRTYSGTDSIQIVPTFQLSWEAQQSERFHKIPKMQEDMEVTYKDDQGNIKTRMMTVTDLIGQKILHYDGLMCDDGIALVDADGSVYKCWAAYGEGHRAFNYVHVQDEDWAHQQFRELISKPMLCEYKTCICDLFNDKWKVDDPDWTREI